jgi:hypothetical protein
MRIAKKGNCMRRKERGNMVRFILKRKYLDGESGMRSEHYETILCEVPNLQSAMCRGGNSANGYDVTDFVGVSIEGAPAEQVESACTSTNSAITPYSLGGCSGCEHENCHGKEWTEFCEVCVRYVACIAPNNYSKKTAQ